MYVLLLLCLICPLILCANPALELPSDAKAVPIWHPDGPSSAFTFARHDFLAPSAADGASPIETVVAFVTAQLSPYGTPDTRLTPSDYGASLPRGGTSQPKLLGAYKLFYNGILAGVGPGRLVNSSQGVDAIDITQLTRAGVNAIGLEGYYEGTMANNKTSFMPRLWTVVVVTRKDGNKTQIGTSASWKSLNGMATFRPSGSSGRYSAPHEFMDMREYPTGWSEPGFDDRHWANAAEQSPFTLTLKTKFVRPIEVFRRKAVGIKDLATGSPTFNGPVVLIDLGRELQGGVNFTLEAAEDGQQATIWLSEEVLPNGVLKFPMRTGNHYVDTWTLRKGRQCVFQHEYMEFRWAMLANVSSSCAQGAPRPCLVDAGAWVIRTPLSDQVADLYNDVPALPQSPLRPKHVLASFESSDASLDAVWNLSRYTLVAISLDVNTDSNTRQRDLCHMDAFVTSIGQLAISNNHAVVRVTGMDAFQVDSNIWQGPTDFRAALISLAWADALYSGDLALVQQRYQDMKKYHSFVHWFNPKEGMIVKDPATCSCPASWSPAGLPAGVYEDLHCSCGDLIDWPPAARDGFHNTNRSVVANSYIALATRRLSDIAEWLGMDDDKNMWFNLSDRLVESMRRELYDSSTGAFRDGVGTDHTAMLSTNLAVMAGAVKDSEVPGMTKSIVSFLKAKGMACSCMMAYWLLEGLYLVGATQLDGALAADLALEFLTSTSKNSWLNMIQQGATAAMEAWTPDEKPNLSWSHPWCSGPNSVIVRLLLGVQPLEMGWKRMQVIPQPSSIAYINATVPASAGVVSLELYQGPNAISLRLGIPANAAIPSTRVCLPPPHGVAAGDAPALMIDGTVIASNTQGRLLCTVRDVRPGTFEISRPATSKGVYV